MGRGRKRRFDLGIWVGWVGCATSAIVIFFRPLLPPGTRCATDVASLLAKTATTTTRCHCPGCMIRNPSTAGKGPTSFPNTSRPSASHHLSRRSRGFAPDTLVLVAPVGAAAPLGSVALRPLPHPRVRHEPTGVTTSPVVGTRRTSPRTSTRAKMARTRPLPTPSSSRTNTRRM